MISRKELKWPSRFNSRLCGISCYYTYTYICRYAIIYFSGLFEPEVLITHTGTARVPWQVLEVPNEAGFEEEVKVERMILKKN